jgi:hypothetical protein
MRDYLSGALIQAVWLYAVFKKHRNVLFSANLRGYLGSRRSDSNINNGIKASVSTEPVDFWVYNNGLTALVHKFNVTRESNRTILKFDGLSIVNGAQTTGAIGSSESAPKLDALVPARFVECSDQRTITNIITFNNSQNRLEAADFRSNDPVQRRLRDEFQTIPDAEYQGRRRGGYEDVIKRVPNLLPADTCAQALANFHQDPVTAYHQKSEIWSSNTLYSKYFSESTTAPHIVLAYSLLKGVETRKLELRQISQEKITGNEGAQLTFLRLRGATFLLTAAIASCIETLAGGAVPNKFRVSFGENTSPETAQEYWKPIVEAAISFCSQLEPPLRSGLKNNDEAARAIANFRSMVDATKQVNASIYKEFAQHLVFA